MIIEVAMTRIRISSIGRFLALGAVFLILLSVSEPVGAATPRTAGVPVAPDSILEPSQSLGAFHSVTVGQQSLDIRLPPPPGATIASRLVRRAAQ